jgi:hypothetical protein
MISPTLVIRRTHMYLALFLFPWMLMYALSTAAMNHRAFFANLHGGAPLAYEREREFVYDGVFADDAELRSIAEQVLAAAGLDGAHGVSRRKDGAIVITRNDLLTPRRLTLVPANRTVLVERLPHRSNALLERFHRRRGYATGYALDTVWAFSVDLVIVAMVFWALSGLWMWWEMRATRRFGAIAVAAGAGLFAFYLTVL